jgi:hypothetical protein
LSFVNAVIAIPIAKRIGSGNLLSYSVDYGLLRRPPTGGLLALLDTYYLTGREKKVPWNDRKKIFSSE